MNGSFNGIQLRLIVARTIEPAPGLERMTIRILSEPAPQLEAMLHLNAPALLILANQEIQGRIVHYSADAHTGYEVTIEAKMR
ncbi:MAG TPA: hypothetical protein VE422_49820 [Terriglobia bacterium]|nr:hypothetical protein [Terriglobia bacterium]